MRSMLGAFILLPCLLLPNPLLAQGGGEIENPFGSLLFTAEEIMQHRRAIDLNDEQRDGITRLIQELQGRAVGLQWRLLDETEEVKDALEGPRVDLDRVMDRFEKAVRTEMEIKEVHLELLVRLKNILSPEQQEELLRLRETSSQEQPAHERK